MKLLQIDSSILGENSVSRSVTAAAVDQLQKAHPGIEVTYRDLVADPLPHLTLPALGDSTVVDEFLASDIVVIGAPMYNFTLSSQLKAWIDRILIAGKTFAYDPEGAKGLAGDKRVIVAIARGGFYGMESPAAQAEHLETYLLTVFGFIGIKPEIIIAEGIAIGPEQRQTALTTALAHAGQLQAA
ncbi:MAG: FMN-dependent NADH-azoreductase [Caulobacteraceae bacterium]|nr:FMN-dependent NADH-azoreductase [Caulobacteraceae bacterium]